MRRLGKDWVAHRFGRIASRRRDNGETVRLRVAELYDDFNDNQRDKTKWKWFFQGSGPLAAEANQRLEVTFPAGTNDAGTGTFWGGYQSRCMIRGDFDFQVDYQLLQWPPNGVRVGINVDSPFVENVHRRGDDLYITHNGSGIFSAPALGDMSGTLRVVRGGGTGAGFYFRNGEWVTIGSGGVSTADALFILMAWGHGSQGEQVKVAFDNFKLQGTILCPSSSGVPAVQTWGYGDWFDGINPAVFQGDPVNSAAGTFSTGVTDLTLPGIGLPFEFERSYTSADTTSGVLGSGWTHSYNASLSFAQNGDATLRAENGQQVKFLKEPDGSYVADWGVLSRLRAIMGGYEVTRKDQTKLIFDSSGSLTEIKDRNGNRTVISYASGKIATVTDTVGRIVTFSYDGAGLLSSIALPDGRTVSYGTPGAASPR